MIDLLSFIMLTGVIALISAIILAVSVTRIKVDNENMLKVASAIQEGASAYLNRQYRTITIIAVILALVLASVLEEGLKIAIGFLTGAFFSALAGYIGMNVSVRSNVRVASEAKRGINEALQMAVRGGAVTGLFVVGLSLLGLSLFYLVYGDPRLIVGFAFGACLISLFARIGGGIYTKSADVGADLVGKVEAGIPEDDPRNPATIADAVGDNVGDCAGMAADLFETYAVTAIGAMLLGYLFFNKVEYILFPLVLGALAILATLVGISVTRIKEGGSLMAALYKAMLVSGIISAILFYAVTIWIFKEPTFFIPAMLGLVITIAIFAITEYFTSEKYKHVKSIAKASQSGPAINIITGFGISLGSTILPVIVICAAILVSYFILGGGEMGLYGISIATMGMLSLTGMIITLDTYGPITDNAAGISEMAGLSKEIRRVTDSLDAIGNTTKAVTKSFAIGSAALAALIFFSAYVYELQPLVEEGLSFNIDNPLVLVGLFIGAAIPFLFSSFAIKAVGVGSFHIVEEVRRQFREIPGIMEGSAKPEYGRCVDIVTKRALKEMIKPGMLAVASPILVGFTLGPEALGAMLLGSIITGLLLALQMSLGGAAWDNAKKYIESGNYGGKRSPAHAAAVIGDTFGDPQKDTAGPAINPLIKVMNTVAILFVPLIATFSLF